MGRANEAEFRADVIATLRQLGYLATAIRRSDRVTIGDVGLPDVIAVHEGTGAFFAIELKVGRRRATPEQLRWVAALDKRATLAAVVYPADWPALAAIAAAAAGHRVSRNVANGGASTRAGPGLNEDYGRPRSRGDATRPADSDQSAGRM